MAKFYGWTFVTRIKALCIYNKSLNSNNGMWPLNKIDLIARKVLQLLDVRMDSYSDIAIIYINL